jgi:hypothetical protein
VPQEFPCVRMPSDIQGIAGNPAVPAAPPQTMAAADRGLSFHDVLSALNPLQYLPVVGTIYRAVTGDVIPEALRRFGSMLVSGLTGGPIGLMVNIAATVAEKATGIDPDKIIADHFNRPPSASEPVQVAAAPPSAAPSSAALPSAGPPSAGPPSAGATAWTSEQLAAYGVSTNAAGNLMLGTMEGADVLNAIQLTALSKTAAAAYAANQPSPSGFAARPG